MSCKINFAPRATDATRRNQHTATSLVSDPFRFVVLSNAGVEAHNHPRLVINEASFTAGLKRLGDGQADRHSLLGKNKWQLSVSDSASVLITVQGVNPDGVEDIVKFSHHLHRVSVR